MDSDTLLKDIAAYCRRVGMAETTFGRLAINDGKLINRLRLGGRVTADTAERVTEFMRRHQTYSRRRGGQILLPPIEAPAKETPPPARDANLDFRFYDNRQKYLLFVNSFTEKQVIAGRVSMELANLHPHPPGLRLFDAGMGDGSVLARVLRATHRRFPNIPVTVVGKEASLEDVRLSLDKMADRFQEHPATMLVVTNMYYPEAPWLAPSSVTAATALVWRELSLSGDTAHDFEEQIAALQPFLAENWRVRPNPSGSPGYERPVVLVIYREDHRFLLDPLRPRRGAARADYDLVIASQPFRARASAEFKARTVLAPLARALAPGGRLICIHSHGDDPGLEIIEKLWPGERPFIHDRHQLLNATRKELLAAGRDLNFNAYSDARSLFRYEMAALPGETDGEIGSSTLLAAWNAAIYVAQIEDHRLTGIMTGNAYLAATREVLRKHGGLWFWDESFIISRKRDFG